SGINSPLVQCETKSYGLASVMDPPPLAWPWKRPAENESSAKVSFLWSRIIRASCSKVHLRLVKKFPGHPPAGAIVPSAAPAPAPIFRSARPAVAPSVIRQPPLAAASRQRPLRSIGGGCGGGGGGGGDAATCSLGGDATRDVLVHALTAASNRSIAAAIALRLPRPPRRGATSKKVLSDTSLWCAHKDLR